MSNTVPGAGCRVPGKGKRQPSRVTASRRPHAARGTRHAARERQRPGFTLVEVLVAAAVLAIGISAGVQTLGAMARASAAAEDRGQAVRLAGERLALLEASDEVASGENQGVFENEPRFQWQEELVAASDPGLLEATVTILWHDGIVERRYSVSTYLLDPAQAPVEDTGDG
jgi:general secretion pathway protein I